MFTNRNNNQNKFQLINSNITCFVKYVKSIYMTRLYSFSYTCFDLICKKYLHDQAIFVFVHMF